MYYVIKNCLIRITSLIEIALEDLISLVYLIEDSLSEESLQAENWSDAVSGITCVFTSCFRSSNCLRCANLTLEPIHIVTWRQASHKETLVCSHIVSDYHILRIPQ